MIDLLLFKKVQIFEAINKTGVPFSRELNLLFPYYCFWSNVNLNVNFFMFQWSWKLGRVLSGSVQPLEIQTEISCPNAVITVTW